MTTAGAMSSEFDEGAPIVACIASIPSRLDLLVQRALPSVLRQDSRRLAGVVVVGDLVSEPSLFARAVEQALGSSWPPALFLDVVANARTQGMSGTGAWNTAAGRARVRFPGGCFLAYLDDDDEWQPSFLSTCGRAARDSGAKLVVAGLERVSEDQVLLQLPPARLTQAQFFEGNPGLQGSNLFVDLELFEKVGGFDETFPSTTDRDLAVRLLDRLDADGDSAHTIPEPLVRHHAHTGGRVTTDLHAKRLGLQRFYERYAPRMEPAVLARSLERAKKLFGFQGAW